MPGLPCKVCGNPAQLNIWKSDEVPEIQFPNGIPYGNLFCFRCYEMYEHQDLPHDLDDFQDLPHDLEDLAYHPEDQPQEDGPDLEEQPQYHDIAESDCDFEEVASQTSFCKFSLSSWQGVDLDEIGSQTSFNLIDNASNCSEVDDWDIGSNNGSSSSSSSIMQNQAAPTAAAAAAEAIDQRDQKQTSHAILSSLSKREIEKRLEDFQMEEATAASMEEALAKDRHEEAPARDRHGGGNCKKAIKNLPNQKKLSMMPAIPENGARRFNDPDLSYQYKGQDLFSDWSADGQGFNQFECPLHGDDYFPGCNRCKAAKNKRQVHMELVQEQHDIQQNIGRSRSIIYVMQSDVGNGMELSCSLHGRDFDQWCHICQAITTAYDVASASTIIFTNEEPSCSVHGQDFVQWICPACQTILKDFDVSVVADEASAG